VKGVRLNIEKSALSSVRPSRSTCVARVKREHVFFWYKAASSAQWVSKERKIEPSQPRYTIANLLTTKTLAQCSSYLVLSRLALHAADDSASTRTRGRTANFSVSQWFPICMNSRRTNLMHKIKRCTAKEIFTGCYSMQFIGLLVVSQNAVLCWNGWAHFSFDANLRSILCFITAFQREEPATYKYEVANGKKIRRASLDAKEV